MGKCSFDLYRAEEIPCGGYECNAFHSIQAAAYTTATCSLMACLAILFATAVRHYMRPGSMSIIQYFPAYICASDIFIAVTTMIANFPSCKDYPAAEMSQRGREFVGFMWHTAVLCNTFSTAWVAFVLLRTLKGDKPSKRLYLFCLLLWIGPVPLSFTLPMHLLGMFGITRDRCGLQHSKILMVLLSVALPMGSLLIGAFCHIRAMLLLVKSLRLRTLNQPNQAKSNRRTLLSLAGGKHRNSPSNVVVRGGAATRPISGSQSTLRRTAPPTPIAEISETAGGISSRLATTDESKFENIQLESITVLEDQNPAPFPGPGGSDGTSALVQVIKWWGSSIFPISVNKKKKSNEASGTSLPTSFIMDADPERQEAMQRLATFFVLFGLVFFIRWLPYCVYVAYSVVAGCTSVPLAFLQAISIHLGGIFGAALYGVLLWPEASRRQHTAGSPAVASLLVAGQGGP